MLDENDASRLAAIINEVANKHNLAVELMKDYSHKSQVLARAREEFAVRARDETSCSYPKIARFVGAKNHTTIMLQVRRFESRTSKE